MSEDAATTNDEKEGRDAALEAMWARVLEAWDDDKPHQAVLSYAIQSGQLPEIAGRYRALLDHPEKGARAKKKIDGIVIAATQMLMEMKTPKLEKVPWQWTASFAVVCALVMIFLAYKMFLHR